MRHGTARTDECTHEPGRPARRPIRAARARRDRWHGGGLPRPPGGPARVSEDRGASKRILPQLAQDEEFVAMFVNEARVCATLEPSEHRPGLRLRRAGRRALHGDGVRATARRSRASSRGRGRAATTCRSTSAFTSRSRVLRGLEYAHAAKDETGALLARPPGRLAGQRPHRRVGRREADRLRHRARGEVERRTERGPAQREARVHVARAGRGARARRPERSLHARHRPRGAPDAASALHAAAPSWRS